MSRTWRVAAGQLRSGDDVRANLAEATRLVREAAAAGASLVVLPEATMVSFAVPVGPYAEPLDGPFAEGLRAAARDHEITVVAGMFEPAPDGRVHNTLLLTGPHAEVAYRKVHLFDAFATRESDHVAPGDGYVTVDVDGVRVGLSTCFDVRFPDQFTALGRAGAEVVALAASWGDGPGKAQQWDLLTAARAHDAQAWVVAAGQAWQPDAGSTPLGVGRSAVVDPTGAVRGRLDAHPGLLVTDVDLELVARTRRQVPILGAERATGRDPAPTRPTASTPPSR
ncbi:carbon-nitrogen hydrolase family protein [Arsenicicoccus dermatophilus]|uniref:carbon-nitrogen hydrolase family protein n=1 Tax=Arsenicicoccus dermatophilus TaxID=1076331 RepID=UPI001F4CFDB9|nr:carbon-nitrogen hydrolase family protein [Arsenicicoccus dermatophilus]